MNFLIKLFKNLALLFIIGIVLFMIFPSQMNGAFNVLGGLFGPLIIVMIILFALPPKRRRRRRRDYDEDD
jgi:hypothetical protein